ASTMKLPVMIQIFRDADAGLLKLDDSLTVHTAFASLVEGAFVVGKEDDSDSTLYALVGRNRSVRDLLERMITRSSNLATNILIERVGADRAQRTARALGAWSIQVLRGVEDGVVYPAAGASYVLVVLTGGIKEDSVAHNLVGDLSRLVYDGVRR